MSRAHVIVRRSGVLWGLPAAGVEGVERHAGGVRVRFAGGGEGFAEAVVTLAADLEVRRPPAPVARRLPAGAVGLALLGGQPVVVGGGAEGAP